MTANAIIAYRPLTSLKTAIAYPQVDSCKIVVA